MGMTIDDLKKECRYCCREIDASGLEGFRCTNQTVIKTTDSSWCYPKNANEPCSTCAHCKPKEETITINNKDLASNLITLAIICATEGTDNCDISLTTSKGKINCHIEFEGVEDGKID